MIAELRVPVIVAPMAGGVSTPELVAEVVRAGGFGFLAAGYLGAEALAEQIDRAEELTGGAYGVNLFVPGTRSDADLTAYRRRIGAEASRYGVEPGAPSWDDDAYPAKLELVLARRVPVVSFTFGCPDGSTVERLHAAGAEVVVTVTTPAEARQAARVGADALCVQGADAGAHRGVFVDDGSPGGGELYGVLALLRLAAADTNLPLIAAGGLVHGADVAAVLVAGAVAAQLGTAFLGCPEAGTQAAHREALRDGTRTTALTRAFTGRPARGLANRFMTEHGPHAPAAYPNLHHLTRPVRGAAGRLGDPEAMSLWAGTTYRLAEPAPAAEVVRRLHEQARDALSRANTRLG
ncbi:NAD(P)H-dependent flavin oxidoreductase [Gandjariella thermophila]|uniref:Propionate 3-nitronate monooxygenase n=1 Tax=Gandjariella thermophila TaxID=1931992 RepID=A0A4D4JAG8_9PSEU|nr:nitronate monooxygenase [Gandjariella thermophila]GDY31436.1 2-nitropropane dioxygenase [Gandjariella thermophila]